MTMELALPRWSRDYTARIGETFRSPAARMELAVELSHRSVLEGTGGPFGAAVFECRSGRLVAVGVNCVLSLGLSVAHAEVMALCLAQGRLGSYDLGAVRMPAHELVSSAQPCAMCAGAVLWSGVTRLVYAATREDVERLVGFDEGSLPRAWRAELRRRGIAVSYGEGRAAAVAVLKLYHSIGGTVYNARRAARSARR
jgi:tRNA(Arg) A34 adenosine deaminase TadA